MSAGDKDHFNVLIRLERNGAIQGGDAPQQDGVHALGAVKGVIHPETFVISPQSDIDVRGLGDAELPYLYGDMILMRVENGRLLFIAPDISGIRDVFYAPTRDGSYLVSDSFFGLAEVCEELTVNRTAVDYFIRHGYFCVGDTYFNEVRRVRTGTKLVFAEGADPSEQSMFDAIEHRQADRSYKGFKHAFRSIFEAEALADDDAILLSGGCDSGLIAALATVECGKKPAAITMQYDPLLEGSMADALRGRVLADICDMEHQVITIDFPSEQASNLDPMVDAMPLAAHVSVNYLKMASVMAKEGRMRLWSGQNADSVYNLGPTARMTRQTGKEDLIKRFFLSRSYIEALPDTRERSVLSPLIRGFGHVGASIMGSRHNVNYTQPKNFPAYFQAYRDAENYLALNTKTQDAHQTLAHPISALDGYRQLFDEKLSAFLVGRDARSVMGATKVCKQSAIRPYSAANMILFFRDLQVSWRDVLSPKRYLYTYCEELMGKGVWQAVKDAGLAEREHKTLKRDAWEKKLIRETDYGKQLLAVGKETASLATGDIDFDKLRYLLGLYWCNRIMDRTKACSPVSSS